MEKNTYKLGIIGAGTIGKKYYEVSKGIKELMIEVIADINEDNFLSIGKDENINTCNVNDLFSYNIDGVLIATPNIFHAKYILKAFEYNLDVLCEKPLAISLSDAKKVLDIEQKENHFLYLALHTRFRPEVEYAMCHLKGKILNIHQYYCENWILAPPWYRNPDICGGGVLLDVGVNQIDWLNQVVDSLDVERSHITKYEGICDLEVEIDWKHALGLGKTTLSWNSTEEKKITYIETTTGSKYILDHVHHSVVRDNQTIFTKDSKEYESVLRDFLKHKKKGGYYSKQEIIKVMSIIRKCYEMCGKDFLSSRYDTI